jgi:hypothetical protein
MITKGHKTYILWQTTIYGTFKPILLTTGALVSENNLATQKFKTNIREHPMIIHNPIIKLFVM